MPTTADLIAPQHSRYAAQRYAALPALTQQLDFEHPWTAARLQQRLDQLLAGDPAEDSVTSALRRLRQEVMLTVMERDLRGQASLDEVTQSMTWLAECTVQSALQWATRTCSAQHGIPRSVAGEPVDLLVIGMGKLGGCELNVSSDIDLIFVYAEDGMTDHAHSALTNHEFFERVGRKAIGLLAETTADGMVFRVDMRLRPYGDAGPLVSSLDMLENYFIAQGREWERYAWLKARVVSQPVMQARPAWQLGVEQLEQLIRPFVYRRYLDFGAIEALRDLHGKIKQELGRRNHQHAELRNHGNGGHQDSSGSNIKLGRGGIREIEFITQVFQLIRGGRDAALRVRATQAALRLCAERGYLDSEIAHALLAAYRFLRQLEHCLQYRDDAQTHWLPADTQARQAIAAMMNLEYESWLAALDQHRALVTQQFDQIFSTKTLPLAAEHSSEAALLQQLQGQSSGEEAGQAAHLLEQVRNGSRYLALAEHHRQRFERLIPQALSLSLHSAQPVTTLHRIFNLLETIGRRGAYLSLLCEYPQAFERVVRLLGSSQWAADFLLRHPLLLDELIDPRALHAPLDLDEFETSLREALAHHPDDTERQMDLMREAHHAQVFHLLLQDLEGVLSVEKLADYLSALADRVLQISLECVWRQLGSKAAAPWPPEPHFAVIGYGKLGSKELGYASDLDVIFLYDDENQEAQEIYARLAQRLVSWLSSRTTAGILFEIDLRLRPNGNAGLLVSSLAAFQRYQRQSAWVWEHQALTRARFCAGHAALGQRFEEERSAILQQPRDPLRLAQDVLVMREKMHAGHPNPTTLFDVKHDPGGMIDIEFAVQYLVLAHSAHLPLLTRNLGNIALLLHCAQAGLIPQALAEQTGAAYRHFRSLQHQLRLNGAVDARVAPEVVAADRTAVQTLWQHLFGTSRSTKKVISSPWKGEG